VRLYIDSIGRDVDIDIEYKRTSRYLVRVTPDMNVRITCPLGAKTFEINRVLDNAKPWIAQRIKKLEKSIILGNESLSSGSYIYLFGDRKTIDTRQGKPKVLLEDDSMIVYVEDESKVKNTFDKWWKNLAEITFSDIINKQSRFFNDMCLDTPSISVKKMYTRWGSCNKRLNKVNLNSYLLSLPYECIEYVIMHELAHLVHQNHKQEFYSLLVKYMPDWKQRKKVIDDNFLLCKKS
jgi:predicted metal-dependent hydrolase